MGRKPEGALATVSSDDGYVDPRKVYDDWSDTYDRSTADIFGVQGEIAEKIASALGVVLDEHKVRFYSGA